MVNEGDGVYLPPGMILLCLTVSPESAGLRWGMLGSAVPDITPCLLMAEEVLTAYQSELAGNPYEDWVSYLRGLCA